jgi:hypothetical protein
MIMAAVFLIYTNWVLGLLVIILLPQVTIIGRKIGMALEIKTHAADDLGKK